VREAPAGGHFPNRSDLARERPRLNEEHARVARFELLLSEPDPFRREVLSAISTVRAELKLPPANAELV